jgi:hypothetical protein
MANIKNGRKIVSVTMLPDLYEKLLCHCKTLDVPVSLWVRKLIQDELHRIENA